MQMLDVCGLTRVDFHGSDKEEPNKGIRVKKVY